MGNRWAKLAGVLSVGALVLRGQAAPPQESIIVPDRVIVVFRGQALPTDAAARVQAAGGVVISRMHEVGILLARPESVSGAALISALRRDNAVLDADYDRAFDLIEPSRREVDIEHVVQPATHFPHPLPTFSPALPADFFYTSTPQQWSVKRVGAQGAGIAGGGAGAWDITMGNGAQIAILDSGVTTVHPDLAPNLVFNAALTHDIPAIFGTPNCEVPDPLNPPFDLPDDQIGHGSFTASLAAAAQGPGTGFLIGVAPRADLLNIKVLRNRPATAAELVALGVPDTPFTRCLFRTGASLVSWVLQGMLLANAHGADVISMSFGAAVPRNFPGGAGAAIWSAFNRVANFVTTNGSVLIAAAGNEATDLDTIGALVPVPTSASHVIAVVATTNPALLPPTPPARQPCAAGADCLAYYSDYGSSLHGLAAPGGDLPAGGCTFSGLCLPTGFIRAACAAGVPGTTAPSAVGYPATGPPPAGTSWGCFNALPAALQHVWYVQAIGTSAATPIVAGVAALVKSANPALSPAQIGTVLQQTADDIGKPGYDQFFNFGLVNATAAVQAAAK